MFTLFNKKKFKCFISFLFVFCILFSNFSVFAEKEKFSSWQELAIRISEVFNETIELTKNEKYDEAYKKMNEAYFGYYEVQGFEKNVMTYISQKRVSHIEWLFGDIKHILLGNQEGSKEDIVKKIEALKVKVYRDALVLDGVIGKKSPDYKGEAVYAGGEVPERYLCEEDALALEKRDKKNIESSEKTEVASQKTKDEKEKPEIQKVDEAFKNKKTFFTAFLVLLREGLEAILVIVAIIAYLVKTGNKHMCKSVYLGSLAAIICSIVLAFVLDMALENSGLASELIEGYTLFFAVAVLFYVSNWILSKSNEEKWSAYIQGKVAESIDKKSQMTLVFAAFLAVLREGAELILFYKASFSSGMESKAHIFYGIVAGVIVLALIYLIFRYTSVKLPLKPFFICTSILLYMMCISFMGKGVIELTEANLISGRTIILPMNGFSIPWLNIYDRAETLFPQMMILIASVWMLIKHGFSSEKQGK